MPDDPTFTSNKTMPMLKMVGFCDRYGTYEGSEWTLYANDVNRDNAIDATARLTVGCLLSTFPEYQCDLMVQDLRRLSEVIETEFGPFGGMEMYAAMNTVIHG